MSVMVADALLDALDRLRNTGPEFNSFLANHGPMAAEAIVQLGADDEVAGWVDRHRNVATVSHGWQVVSGLIAAFAALREYRISGDMTVLVGADRFRGRIERPERSVPLG